MIFFQVLLIEDFVIFQVDLDLLVHLTKLYLDIELSLIYKSL
jgi:hypothetical protein